jgi:putative glutamine amidotransferase
MSKPLIGLTTSCFFKRSDRTVIGVNEPYTISIVNAGGIPILVPINLSDEDTKVLLSRVDGILFTGGYDVDPKQYGNPPHARVEGIDADRDRVEIHLIQTAMRINKPMFGICRGCQVINVALGGSLYEDLDEQHPGAVSHDRHDRPRDYLSHQVALEPDSHLMEILVTGQAQVNSLHHQGIRRLAQELKVAATAPDGLVEAFEITGQRFGLAVQWHPEELQAHKPMRRLFEAFVEACVSDNFDHERRGL